MNKLAFRNWFCGKRDCALSSGVTTFYNLRKLRTLTNLSEVIPLSTKWVSNKVFSQLDKLSDVTKKNYSASLVAYLKAAKAPQSLIERVSGMKKQQTSQRKNFIQKPTGLLLKDD